MDGDVFQTRKREPDVFVVAIMAVIVPIALVLEYSFTVVPSLLQL